jgi:capsular exopolysaccharide synthesis family protein
VSDAKGGKESVPLAVLRGIARRWRTAVGLGLLTAGIVGTTVWFTVPPPVPTASVQLYMPQRPQGKLGEHPDPPLERATQVELIKSKFVLSAALRTKDVGDLPVLKEQDDPVAWLAKKLTVEFIGPEILKISLSYDEGEQAKKIIDAIKQSYLDGVANKSNTTRAGRLRELRVLEGEQKQALKRLRKQITEMSNDPAATDTEKEAFKRQTLEMKMADARRQLTRTESDLRLNQTREWMLDPDAKVGPAIAAVTGGAGLAMRMYERDARLDLADSALDAPVDLDHRVRASLGRLKDLEANYESTYKKAKTPDRPEVKEAATLVANHKRDHEGLRARVRDEIRTQLLTQTKSERERDLAHVRQQGYFLREQVNQLQTEVDIYTKTLSDHAKLNFEIAPLAVEVKQSEDLLAGILKQIIVLTVEEGTPPRVEPMDDAIVTKADAEKRKILFTTAGALGGLAAVLALVGLLEYRLRRVESAEAVSTVGLRVVGTVPRPRAGGFRWATGGAADTVGMSEAIACTRTMLLHGEGLSAHRVLLITSPVSGEGKTTLTTQLAVSIALSGRRTLLIDGDLRNPMVHQRLGVPNGPGTCEVLRGEASLFEVARETAIPGLHFVSGGQWTPETPQALVTAPLAEVFALWREQYEFVLIDSSPVLPVADALLLARHTDGVILSLLQGVSRLTLTTEACQRFATLGVNVLGAVVNGTPHRIYGDVDNYYYHAKSAPAPTEEAQ